MTDLIDTPQGTPQDTPQDTHYDILIIGAGLSGIGTACKLATECPGKRVAILERREAIGGTWDLFRYPGIRSDSDMYSFGFKFKPWGGYKVLAEGDAIREYVRETAAEYDVEQQVQFGLKVEQADWSSADQQWTLRALHEPSGQTRRYTCSKMILCTGYYDYDRGHAPDFPGADDFGGQIIHPQQWPEDLDYTGKRVVVIGSGATAVTLVPSMAQRAGHITMLQRSPSYIFAVPQFDKISKVLGWFLPGGWVYKLARWRNILIQRWLYKAAKRWPGKVRSWLLGSVRKQLKDPDTQMRHFTPDYDPWDQRLCAVPDGDLFTAINAGAASVVTDHIDRFDATGIQLKSGEHIDADIIITATGLRMQLMGGMNLAVDGKPRAINQTMTYKSVLLEGVPNAAYVFGYTNAPWTLKAELAADYLCRLVKHMDKTGAQVFVPRDTDDSITDDIVMGTLSSGYVQRAADRLPRQGRAAPWRVLDHYEKDKVQLGEDPIDDGVLLFDPPEFTTPADPVRRAA